MSRLPLTPADTHKVGPLGALAGIVEEASSTYIDLCNPYIVFLFLLTIPRKQTAPSTEPSDLLRLRGARKEDRGRVR